MQKYDVFISCKSEDYPLAEKVYDFLVDKGMSVFLASKELRIHGESEYRNVIEKAIFNCSHLIIVASQAEYIESKWVKYEWDLFLDCKLAGKKDGNLITILKGVPVTDIYFTLGKYQSIDFDNFESEILDYLPKRDAEDSDPKPTKRKFRVPEWVVALVVIVCFFVLTYAVFFTIGYEMNRNRSNPDTDFQMQSRMLAHAKIHGSVIEYNDLGIIADYDAESGKVIDVRVEEQKFEISGSDFWRAASISSGFALWASNMKYLKALGEGKVKAAVAVGSLIGTLFGYSTGKYIAQQNNLADTQAQMVDYLKMPEHWLGCQLYYNELKQFKPLNQD